MIDYESVFNLKTKGGSYGTILLWSRSPYIVQRLIELELSITSTMASISKRRSYVDEKK